MKKLLALNVDDLTESRILIRRILEKHHYEVVDAEGADRALEALEQAKYDVVVLDVVMSGMDGFEVARKIRNGESGEPNRNTIIVGHSGLYIGDRDVSKAATGMDYFFSKPIHIQEFADKVNELVGQLTQ